MKLLLLQAKNIFQHSELDLAFSNGLTGILGPNGSGKSNLINAIKFALTGYLSHNKTTCLKYGTSSGFVSLDVLCEEQHEIYRIRRNLHNSSVYIYRNTGHEFELLTDKATSANAFLEENIPISKEVADRVLLTPQEDMWALFRMTSAERNKVLQSLLDLNIFNKVREKLRVYLRDTGDFLVRLDAQERMLEEQELAQRQYLLSFSSVLPLMALDNLVKSKMSEVEHLNSQIQAWDTYLFYQAKCEKLEAQRAQLQNVIAIDKEPTCEIQKTADEIWASIQELDKQIETLNVKIEALRRYFEAPGFKFYDSSLEEALQEKVVSKMTIARIAEDKYNHIRHIGTSGKCPTCGAPVTYTEADLKRAQKDYESACKQRDEAIEMLKEQRDYKDEIEECNRRQAHVLAEVKRLIPECRPINEALFADLCAEVEELCSKRYKLRVEDYDIRVNYESSHKDWENTCSKYQADLASIDATLAQIRENFMTKPEGESKDELLKLKEAQMEKLDELNKQRDIRIRMDAATEELNHILKEQQRVSEQWNALNPEYREQLLVAQELLHPTKIPTLISDEIFKMITMRLNNYLQEFDAPYSIELSGGEFNAVFGNGMVQPAVRLSGGEKMILAIAFRLALHSVFATDDMGGFLFLDEPTTFLDDKNRDALVRVLDKLKTSPKFSNLQVFVVTHDEILRPLFTSVVDITK